MTQAFHKGMMDKLAQELGLGFYGSDAPDIPRLQQHTMPRANPGGKTTAALNDTANKIRAKAGPDVTATSDMKADLAGQLARREIIRSAGVPRYSKTEGFGHKPQSAKAPRFMDYGNVNIEDQARTGFDRSLVNPDGPTWAGDRTVATHNTFKPNLDANRSPAQRWAGKLEEQQSAIDAHGMSDQEPIDLSTPAEQQSAIDAHGMSDQEPQSIMERLEGFWNSDNKLQQVGDWAKANKNPLMVGGGLLAGGAGLYGLYRAYQAQKEQEEEDRMERMMRRRMMFKGASAFEQGVVDRLDAVGMHKVADRLVNEQLRGLVPALMLPYGGAAAHSVGQLTGMVNPEKYKDNMGWGSELLPGVAGRRTGQRLALVSEESERMGGERAKRNMLSEQFGPTTSMLTSMGIGAGLGGTAGAALGGNIGSTVSGAGLGALGGLGVSSAATIAASLAAAIKRRRTMREQADNDKDSNTSANLLIPGVAAYDYYKRLGASRNLIEDKDKEKSAAFQQGVMDKLAQTTLRTPEQAAATVKKLGPATRASVMKVPEVAKTVAKAAPKE